MAFQVKAEQQQFYCKRDSLQHSHNLILVKRDSITKHTIHSWQKACGGEDISGSHDSIENLLHHYTQISLKSLLLIKIVTCTY